MGYDGLGRRISKTVRHTNGTTAITHYGWDGDRIVREESDNQRITVVYEPGSFVPMLRIDDTQQGQVLSAFVTDALGTPRCQGSCRLIGFTLTNSRGRFEYCDATLFPRAQRSAVEEAVTSAQPIRC
ncbi:core protein [Halomonas citrativorans]|uniref:Core protein n=1 Tax=Halomonas citrativorans TaxID=2742612 RepID=A0A1R4HUC7_9GAMM|nr:hypothetical protein [Halomonas citrativorans]SJN11201.1 core protein [Halomonas citrativorans]